MLPSEVEEVGFKILPSVLSKPICDRWRDAIQSREGSMKAGLRQPHESIPEIRGDLEAGLLDAILPSGAFLVRSILFDKSAERNWMVPWHQDLAICVRERKETTALDRGR